MHFTSLDGLRGIAILFVMVYHFHFVFWSDSGIGYWIFRALNFGWSGVDLFFVLSGFLITGILLDSKGKPGYFRGFYIRRALRILPLYYAFLLVVFGLLYPISRTLYIGPWATWYFVYLSNWKGNHGADGLLSHLWSLAVEEQFYLVWPLVIRFTAESMFPIVSLAVIIAVPVLRFALLAHGADPETVYRLTVTRMDALAIGSLVAWLLRSKYWGVVKKNVALVTLASLLVVTIIVILDHGPEWTGLMMTFGDSVLILLFAAIVAICVDGSHLASWVSASWLVRMGKYSYSMYLFQEIVYELTPRFLKDFTILSPFLAKLLFIPGAIGVTFVCGALSWRLFERRFLVLKDRLAPRAI